MTISLWRTVVALDYNSFISLIGYFNLHRFPVLSSGFKIIAGCRRQLELLAHLPLIFHQGNRILQKILCLLIVQLKLKSLSCYDEHFVSDNRVTKKCFKSFLETYTSTKFRNLKRATGSIFVQSIQLSTYSFKRETCKYTPSRYRVYVSARTYYS